MKFLLVTALLSSLDLSFGFCTPPPAALFPRSSQPNSCAVSVNTVGTALFAAEDGGGRQSSRLEGNMRPPTKEELPLMDEMITKLADAKPYELPNAVRWHVLWLSVGWISTAMPYFHGNVSNFILWGFSIYTLGTKGLQVRHFGSDRINIYPPRKKLFAASLYCQFCAFAKHGWIY